MTAENIQPEEVFQLPNEVVEKMQRTQRRRAKAPTVQYEQIPVEYDFTPIGEVADPEIVATTSGPMLVRRRHTTTKLYRRDGREATVAISQKNRYLNKRDKNGHPVFFTSPPPGSGDELKFTKICPYCFKKLRAMTSLEKEANAYRMSDTDPEVKELLESLKADGLYTESFVDLEDDTYILARHINKKHRSLATFRNDPILKRLDLSKA